MVWFVIITLLKVFLTLLGENFSDSLITNPVGQEEWLSKYQHSIQAARPVPAADTRTKRSKTSMFDIGSALSVAHHTIGIKMQQKIF